MAIAKSSRNEPKSINIFLGFFLSVNNCLGTGFLGVPYSFFYAGYLAAIPTLLVIAFVSWSTACYTVECMARAQALESYREYLNPGVSSNSTDKSITEPKHPQFCITLNRKFEPSELCEVFFNRWVKYFYTAVMAVFSLLSMWALCTVAGSAWAVNIPFRFNGVHQCQHDAFLHQVIPINSNPGCLGAYYFSLMMFAVIVITLSLIDLKEQAIVQMVLGFMRFFTVGAIIVYCIVKLTEGGEICEPDKGLMLNLSVNGTQQYVPLFANATRYTTMQDIALKHDVKGWIAATPVFTYALLYHVGIPSLTHPIKQKQYLRWLMVMMFAVSLVCYMSLGVVVPLWFKYKTQETCTLNWSELTQPGNSPQLRALSYYLIFFPSLDVISAYPLSTHITANNIYTTIMGRDTSKKATYRDSIFQVLLRLVVAVLPILAAFGVANLIYVLKYAGLIGFLTCIFFPTILQLRSITICKRVFASVRKNSVNENSVGEKSPLLLIQDEDAAKGRALYMTPYSSYWSSNPVSVSVIGFAGLSLFLLACISLSLHPTKLTCELDL